MTGTPGAAVAQVVQGSTGAAHSSQTGPISHAVGSVSHSHHPISLDLSSQSQSVFVGRSILPHGTLATINVGGTQTVVHVGEMVTSAEYAAIKQVIGGGPQNLVLDSSGRAVGGMFSLNSIVSRPGGTVALSSLFIPAGVTALDDFAASGLLKVAGNITNDGKFYAFTSNPQVTSAGISSLNLFNQSGALLTSILPSSGLPGINSARPLNLSIAVANNFINSGTISSSANLNVAASNFTNSGAIASSTNTNAVVANQFQNLAGGQIQAGGSLYINTGSMVNAGLISALGSQLSITGGGGGALSINNTGGLIQADSGTINIASGNGLDLSGGVLQAGALRFSAPAAPLSVAVDSLNGPVYIQAGTAKVDVVRGALLLEEVDVSSDPIFTNSTTDLYLPATITTGGGAVTAIAAGSIYGNGTSGTTIDTSSSGAGGDVIMLAGAANSTVNGTTIVTGASGMVGNISGIVSINTSGSPSGNIILGSFSGSVSVGSITASGANAVAPSNSSTVSPAILKLLGLSALPGGTQTASSPPPPKGQINIYAPVSISTGDIQSNGTNPMYDQIQIATVLPVVGQRLAFNSSGGLVSGTIGPASQVAAGTVTTGGLNTGYYDQSGNSAGSISIVAGSTITTGYLRTLGAGAAPRGAALQGYNYNNPGGSSGSITIISLTGQIIVNGDINTSGGGGGGGGANVGEGGPGGNGGNVYLSAQANITVNGPILTVGGGGGGGSGICSCDTAGGGGSLGNSGGPDSGGLFQTWPPYEGPGWTTGGLVVGNPNNPPFPYPGQGGSHTAYDLGCCGGGNGGNAGTPGSPGGTGTFQMGTFDDESPSPGGPAGASGNITISGRDISVTRTLGSYYGFQNGASSSPFAPYSIYTYSTSGGGAVTINSVGIHTSTSAYNPASDLTSTAAAVTALLRAGQLSLAGLASANSISLNNTAAGISLTSGVHQLPLVGSGQLTITENYLPKEITGGQSVTPAEWIALIQVSDSQAQPLTVGTGGFASGGTFAIASVNLPAGGFTTLNIPLGVTANATAPTIQVNGTATITGSLQFAGSGTLSAQTISLNGTGTLLSNGAASVLTVQTNTLDLAAGASISSGGDVRFFTQNTAAPLNVFLANGGERVATRNGTILFNSGSQGLSFLGFQGASASTLTLSGGPASLQVNGAALNIASVVTISANNTLTAQVNNGQFVNNGSLNSSTASGAAGAIAITSNGSLQITKIGVLSTAAINSGGGPGGSITISAPNGTLTMPGTTLNVNATGSGNFGGGQIVLSGLALVLTGSNPLVLDANGAGGGNGGSVSVTTTGAGSTLTIGNGQVEVYASGGSGGSSGSNTGDGGKVIISSGGDLTVDPNYILAAPSGASGKGATKELSAGVAGAGNLLVSSALDASGVGAGDGGKIVLSSNSSVVFLLGTATNNGTQGLVSANGGQQSGAGGCITISNLGSGGVTLPEQGNLSYVPSANGGNGGKLTLSAPGGTLTIPAGTYVSDGVGAAGAGGQIVLLAQQLVVTSVASPPGGPPSPVGLVLSASGAGSGAGGLVSVTVTGANQDLSTGTGAGQVVAFATGGSAVSGGSSAGDGGTIVLSAARNLTVDTGQIQAQPLGQNGKGAQYTLQAGTGQSGDLTVTGDLLANGGGSGSGGAVTLSTNSSNTFTVGGSSTGVGVSGSISATGGTTSGDGGSISITNTGIGGITIDSFDTVSVAPSSAGGGGGKLILAASGGTLTLPAGSFSASATAGQTSSGGGLIQFSGTAIALTGSGGISLTANAIGGGNGGSITIVSSGAGSNLGIGLGSQPLNLQATGGSSKSSTGDGGSITVSAGGDLRVDVGSFKAGPQGTNGGGARITFTAGTAGSGNLSVNGGISANGAGNGGGGLVSLTSSSAQAFLVSSGTTGNGVNGAVTANAGSTAGDGGSISISNQGTGGVSLPVAGSISVSPSSGGGNGGKLSIVSALGPLTITSGTLSADALGSSSNALSGGSIQLVAATLTIVGQSALALSANAATPAGSGGTITVNISGATSDLTIGNSIGGVTVSAYAGSQYYTSGGTSGTVSISAGRNLTVQSSALSLPPQGGSGNGGKLTLQAGQAAYGNLQITGDLNEAGLIGGNGGTINLAASGQVQVTGNISVAGGDFSSTTAAGNAGTVTVQSGNCVWITGNVMAGGGSNAGVGAGGSAGTITIATSNNTPNQFYIGSVQVGGTVDLHGGTSTGGGPGGSGGSLSVNAGTFQVLGTVSGVSINATASASAPLPATGSISINTYGTQPLPLDFDLTSPAPIIPALPGGLFSVGNATVNGTAGSITAVGGSATASNAPAVSTSTGPFAQGNITIKAAATSANINAGGFSLSITTSNSNGQRVDVTPGEALALYQVTRGLTQTVVLSGSNQGLPPGVVLDGSTITINQVDLYGSFSTFNVRTFGSLTNQVTVNVIGTNPSLQLSSSNVVDIGGTLNFSTAGASALINLGPQSLVINATGNITAGSSSQLSLTATNSGWLILGSIRSGSTLINANGGSLGITMGTTGILGGTNGAGGTVSVNANYFSLVGGQISNATLQIGTTSPASAVNVSTTFGTGGMLGDVFGNQIYIYTAGALPIASNADINSTGPLTLVSGGLSAGTNVTIDSGNTLYLISTGPGSSMSFGSGLQISAGNLTSTAPSTGALVSGNVAEYGSLIILSVGSGGLSFGSGSKIASNGGDVQLSSLALGSSLTIPDSTQVTANGGSIILTAQNQVSLGASVTVNARSLNGGTGNVIITAMQGGLTVGSGSGISGAAMVVVNSPTGAITFSGANAVTMTAGLTIVLTGSSFTTNAGAVVTAGQYLQVVAGGGISLESGSKLSASVGMLLLTQGNLTVSDNVTLSNSMAAIQLMAVGPNSVLSIGSGVNLTSGSLSGGAPASGPLSAGNLIQPGSVIAVSAGSGGLTVGTSSKITSNGGIVELSSVGLGGVISLSDSDKISANGGSVMLMSTGETSFGAADTVNARTLSGGAGNVIITAVQGLGAGSGTSISGESTVIVSVPNGSLTFSGANGVSVTAGQYLQMSATGGISLNSGSQLSSVVGMTLVTQGNLTISDNATLSNSMATMQLLAVGATSTLSIGSGVKLASGSLAGGAPASGPLSLSNIGQFGTIVAISAGSGGVSLGSGSSITSNGGTVQVYGVGAAGGINVSDSTRITANGGTVIVVALGAMTMGSGDQITARSLGGGSGNVSITAVQGFSLGVKGGISALGALQVIVPVGSLGVGAQAQISSSQLLLLQSVTGLTISDSSALSCSSCLLQLNSVGVNSTLSIGSGVTLSAGTLASGAPAGGPLVSTNVANSGSINLISSGSGGISVGAGSSITSNGGNSQVLSLSPGSSLDMASTSQLTANGGQVTMVSQGEMTIGSTAATTLNGGAGMIMAFAPQGMTVGGGSNLSAATGLMLMATGAASTLTIDSGAELTSGSLVNGAAAQGMLAAGSVAQSGWIRLSSYGSGGISVQSSASVTSNGADLNLIATSGNIVIGNKAQFQSSGGNVFILTMKAIDGTAGGASFTARAVGNAAFSSGGEIELGSGIVSPEIGIALSMTKNTNPLSGKLDTGAGISNSNGVLWINTTGTNIQLNPGPGLPSSLTLNHGYLQFDQIGNGSSVVINQGTFVTSAYQPISYRLPAAVDPQSAADDNELATAIQARVLAEPGTKYRLSSPGEIQMGYGSLFVEAACALTITCELGHVHVRKGGLLQVDSRAGCLRVRACSLPGDVVVVAGRRSISLNPGREVTVTDHDPSADEINPYDGIGRRLSVTHGLQNGLYATSCEFSLVTAINRSSGLCALGKSGSHKDRRLLERLLHAAAAVDVVSRGRGVYRANEKRAETFYPNSV